MTIPQNAGRYAHGGDVYSRPVDLDFSANLNPLGLPPGVRQALIDHLPDCVHYPDPVCRTLRAALSQQEGLPPERIVCGNGAADLIYRIVRVLKPRRALVLAPTFSEYEKALAAEGCQVIYHALREEEDFQPTQALLPALRGVDMAFLCTPNNPTGAVIEPALMEQAVAQCRAQGVFLVLDECFMDFVAGGGALALRPGPGAAVLKAFTKMYAMAGLRLGYMLFGDESLAARVQDNGPCWNVSVPAQAAGLAALKETAFAARTRSLTDQERPFLAKGLQALGAKVYPSRANFLLFRHAAPLDRLLLPRRIAIRSCSNYVGLDSSYFRTAVRTHEENETLLHTIKEVLGHAG